MSTNTTDNLQFTSEAYQPFADFWKAQAALLHESHGFDFFEKPSDTNAVNTLLSKELSATITNLVGGNDMGMLVVLVSAMHETFARFSRGKSNCFKTPLMNASSISKKHATAVYLVFDNQQHTCIKDLLTATKTTISQSYTYQNYPAEALLPDDRHVLPLQYEPLHGSNQGHGFFISKKDGQFDISCHHADGLDKQRCLAFLSSLELLLQAYANPATNLADAHWVSSEVANQLTQAPVSDYPKTLTLAQLFEAQVLANPQQPALLFNEEVLSYEALNSKANQLAHYLHENCEIGLNHPVAILLDRSPDMIISILAVLKAGAAYLPIDPSFPIERIQFMMDDAEAKAIITHSDFFELLEDLEIPAFITDLQLDYMDDSTENPVAINQASDLAYIMYTSGSTGTPKGTLTNHYNVSRVVKNTNYIVILPSDRILQLSNFAFDGSVFDIFGALLNGATLVLVDKKAVENPQLLAALFPNITVSFITTALFNALVEVNIDNLKNIRKLLFGGERVSVKHVQKALDFLGPDKLIHVYGPTESTVFATAYPINQLDETQPTIPIGKAISNTEVYLLDEHLKILPAGIPGEICISGDGLCKGYLNRDALNAEKFVDHPFKAGEKLYRTADLAKWDEAGDMIFMDRLDKQVKIRGFRIELGEIEAAILLHPNVKEVIAAVRQDSAGDRYIAAYLTQQEANENENFKEYLADHLPKYMIPTHVVTMEALPMTNNGKIDQKALPDPLVEMHKGAAFTLPSNETESILLDIWKDVLGTASISTTDNFFELGGNSLKATVLVSKTHQLLQVDMPLLQLFDQPTIQETAVYIQSFSGEAFEHIPVAASQAHYPLSSVQKRIFILHELAPEQLNYNTPLCFKINGELNIPQLEAAFLQVMQQHEIYRTVLSLHEGEPVQQILPLVDFHITTEQGEMLDAAFQAFIQPFDLSKPPFIRAGVFSDAQKQSYLFMDIHHIVSDGVSLNILVQSLMLAYAGEALPAVALQYKDFAVWQSDFFNSSAFQEQKSYWLHHFKDGIPVMDMPTDHKRPALQSFEGNTLFFNIPSSTYQRIKDVCQATQTTPFMVLLSAFKILLSKYANQTDICVGTPVSGRSHADLHQLPGVFINTLVLKSSLNSNDTYATFLEEVKHLTLSALANQDFPFESLVEALNPTRDLSRNALFDAMFTFQNMTIAPFSLDGVALEFETPAYHISKFDLTFSAKENETDIEIGVEYATQLFEEKTIRQLFDWFLHVLNQTCNNLDMPLAEVSLLNETQQQAQLAQFNPWKPTATDVTLVDLFKKQVASSPVAIALSFEETNISYETLDRLTDQMAQTMMAQLDVTNSIIAVQMDRNTSMVYTLLAILKAGGAYLPLDPSFPEERVRFMLSDAKAKAIITPASFTQDCPATLYDLPFIKLSDVAAFSPNALPTIQPSDLAYLIYTSGSTGKPKGVMVTHSNVCAFTQQFDVLGIQAGDSMAAITNITFDISVLEIFGCLVNGVKVVLVNSDNSRNPAYLLDLITEGHINSLQVTPSRLSTLLTDGKKQALALLKTLLVGGEALHPSQAQALLDVGVGNAINVYGPTETTIWSSFWHITSSEVKIGKPFANEKMYILDSHKQPVAVGVKGEIYISGQGVTKGYVNHETLTAAAFTEDLFTAGQTMYHTGDTGCWNHEGEITYLGRIDEQVKLRGYRIELDEIASVLEMHSSISAAVVVLVSDKGHEFLHAYYVSEQALDGVLLKEHLMAFLPEYMIPSGFQQMDKMPLNTSGKVDKKQLPALAQQANQQVELPQNSMQQTLWELWADILKHADFGINHNFFDVGGHSLRATQLVSLVYQAFEISISLRDVFQHTTIAEQVLLLSQGNVTAVKPLQITPVATQDFYPLSSQQQRIFILQAFEKNLVTYNMPLAVKVLGELDIDKLQHAFQQMLNRHAILRTNMAFQDGIPVQFVAPHVEGKVKTKNCLQADVTQAIEAFIRPFDLENALLVRMQVLVSENQDCYLLLDTHHVISDGISSQVFMQEIMALYEGQALPAITLDYKDYAVYQQAWRSSFDYQQKQAYWLNKFQDSLPVLDFPLDFNRPKERSFSGNTVDMQLDKNTWKQLEAFTSKHQVTTFSFLMSVYVVLLHQWTRQQHVVIGTPVSGRTHAATQQMLGMFTNTLALPFELQPNDSFETLVKRAHKNIIADLDHQAFPFEALVDQLDIGKSANRNPLFDVAFVLQNMESSELNNTSLAFEAVEVPFQVAKFDLTLTAVEQDDTLNVFATYVSDLFKESTMVRFLQQYGSLIASVLENPKSKLNEITLISEQERALLLTPNTSDYPKTSTLAQLFEKQVLANPQQTALLFNDTELSYEALNNKANQLAHYLHENCEIGLNHPVAILLDRSPDMIISILAVLKAGAAYLPIDPSFPIERIQFMMDDAEAKAIITHSDFFELLEDLEIPAFITDLQLDDMDDSTDNPVAINQASDLAYIMYTSGSTGTPKGTLTSHYNVSRVVKNTNYITILPSDRILQLSNFAFDGSVFDIFGALLNGATLVLVDKKAVENPQLLAALFPNITVSFLTTALFNALVDVNLDTLKNIRKLLFGGERVSVKHVQKALDFLGSDKLIHVYGPTESTVFATAYPINQLDETQPTIPIGKAISNTEVYVLDEHLNILPAGIPGEICISGDGLCSGYLNRDALNAEKFVDHPFKAGEKLYRTADLAKWDEAGNMIFMDRLDKQVKIRGFRIELGEIEAAMLLHSNVKEVIAVVRQDSSGDRYIAAYLTQQQANENENFKEYLADHLPKYMIPTHVVTLEALPMTNNGKIDQKALPDPLVEMHKGAAFTLPSNETESILLDIWKDVLGTANISTTDNFFELGGNSLKMMALINQLHVTCKKSVAIADAFSAKDLQAFALLLTEEKEAFPLHTLNSNDGTKLFLFPPGLGLGMAFQGLAEAVQHTTIHAFDYLPTDDNINTYISLILATQPEGPYVLGGYSAGGNLAFDVAKAMEKQGLEVSHIILLDSYLRVQPENLLPEEIDKHVNSLLQAKDEHEALADMPLETLTTSIRHYFEYFFSSIDSGKLAADIHLLTAENDLSDSYRQRTAWAQAGNVSTHPGSGKHDTLLHPDHIQHQAHLIDAILVTALTS